MSSEEYNEWLKVVKLSGAASYLHDFLVHYCQQHAKLEKSGTGFYNVKTTTIPYAIHIICDIRAEGGKKFAMVDDPKIFKPTTISAPINEEQAQHIERGGLEPTKVLESMLCNELSYKITQQLKKGECVEIYQLCGKMRIIKGKRGSRVQMTSQWRVV